MLEFHNSDFILDVMTVPVISRSEVWSPYNADKGKVTNLGLLHKEEYDGPLHTSFDLLSSHCNLLFKAPSVR